MRTDVDIIFKYLVKVYYIRVFRGFESVKYNAHHYNFLKITAAFLDIQTSKYLSKVYDDNQ